MKPRTRARCLSLGQVEGDFRVLARARAASGMRREIGDSAANSARNRATHGPFARVESA
jgi:hypothetical protein